MEVHPQLRYWNLKEILQGFAEIHSNQRAQLKLELSSKMYIFRFCDFYCNIGPCEASFGPSYLIFCTYWQKHVRMTIMELNLVKFNVCVTVGQDGA